jgi:hypothetical protein
MGNLSGIGLPVNLLLQPDKADAVKNLNSTPILVNEKKHYSFNLRQTGAAFCAADALHNQLDQ